MTTEMATEPEARGRVILRSVLKCTIKIAGDADSLISSISDKLGENDGVNGSKPRFVDIT